MRSLASLFQNNDPSQVGASSDTPQITTEAAKAMLMFAPQTTVPPSRRRATTH